MELTSGKEKLKRVIQNKDSLLYYTYISPNGKIFTALKHSLQVCREARDKWLKEKVSL